MSRLPLPVQCQGGYTKQVDEFTLAAGLSVIAILAALLVLYIELPRVKKVHLIVCEQGLLQITNKQVDVVHWSDVLVIEKYFGEYVIKRRENERFSLTSVYQNVKELVEMIRLRSGIR
jgi:hypothetical protein